MSEAIGPFEFGRDELGPAIADYMAGLWATCSHFEAERNAQVLFVSRAGVRISRALDAYLQSQNQTLPETYKMFWISRLMVAKGTWEKNPVHAAELLSRELATSSLEAAALALFPSQEEKPDLKLPKTLKEASGAKLGEALLSKDTALDPVRSHLKEQSALFSNYLKAELGDKSCALLVDTGWQGTAQRLLQEACPDIDWWGAYFGRAGFSDSDRKYWHKMIGLVFEADQFDPAKPETCVINHRHMIESLFEPGGNSIERLASGDDGRIFAPEAASCLTDSPTRETDPVFCGVLEHLGNLPAGISRADLNRGSRSAWRAIAKRTLLPRPEDVDLFAGKTRSADFGRELKVPLVFEKAERFEGDTPAVRIAQAIWPAGQMAVEYPREIAFAMQTKAAGLDHRGLPEDNSPPKVKSHALTAEPLVAVITRTMDRPMFLKRALESVNNQTFRNYIHVVVSDGGDIEVTRNAIEAANIEHARVLLVDNVVNRGMEAASNIAIASSQSKYIVIHDDDDSWEPEFLEKTVDFLEGPKGAVYAGVITKSVYVSEEVTHEGIQIHDTRPYQEWVQNVSLGEMIAGNFFAPISFVFRRDIYDRIGGYNDAYPVLGDWDFNIRFLMEADIGVIDQPLANYHHRDRGDTNVFGNSVISGVSKHVEYSAVVRNTLIRSAARDNNPALATLAGLGAHLHEQRALLRGLNGRPAGQPEKTDKSMNQQSLQVFDQMWVGLYNLFNTAHPAKGTSLPIIGWIWSRLQIAWFVWRSVRAGRFDHFVEHLSDTDVMKRSDIPPPVNFDDDAYLRNYPDVASAVKAGGFTSGFAHYFRNGIRERRQRSTK